MVLGSPYERLVAANDKPLASAQVGEEKRKLEIARSKRQRESPHKRSESIAKYENDRKHDHALMDEMVKAFDLKLLNETTLDDHRVYLLEAAPHLRYHPPNMEAQALTGMQGKLWIDKDRFRWVNVEAEVTCPVSIEGFLARLEPGTRFELEKAAAAPDIWLPKHCSVHSQAEVLFLFNHHDHDQDDETYFNYQKDHASANCQAPKKRRMIRLFALCSARKRSSGHKKEQVTKYGFRPPPSFPCSP
jgi:hypothetical protein